VDSCDRSLPWLPWLPWCESCSRIGLSHSYLSHNWPLTSILSHPRFVLALILSSLSVLSTLLSLRWRLNEARVPRIWCWSSNSKLWTKSSVMPVTSVYTGPLILTSGSYLLQLDYIGALPGTSTWANAALITQRRSGDYRFSNHSWQQHGWYDESEC